MAKEAYLKSPLCDTDTVKYTNSSAVVAGEIINVAGIGTMIASADYGTDVSGVYYIKGIFQVALTSGVTASQGNKIYWDASAGTAILSSSTSLVETDPYLGRAVANGTASGGYVDVELKNGIDYLAG